MKPRFYPDARSLPAAQTLPLDAPFAAASRLVMRETPPTATPNPSAQPDLSTPNRGGSDRFAPTIRGLCNALPLSIVLWGAVFLVCCG